MPQTMLQVKSPQFSGQSVLGFFRIGLTPTRILSSRIRLSAITALVALLPPKKDEHSVAFDRLHADVDRNGLRGRCGSHLGSQSP
jgi:hypothetical protein